MWGGGGREGEIEGGRNDGAGRRSGRGGWMKAGGAWGGRIPRVSITGTSVEHNRTTLACGGVDLFLLKYGALPG